MVTAARRARKKANKAKGLKGWSDEVMLLTSAEARQIVSDLLDSPVTTESEHAAALTALAQVKKMRKRAAGE